MQGNSGAQQGPSVSDRRLLVAYSNASTFTTTTFEYLDSFGRHLPFEVHYLHVTHDARPCIDLAQYDAVLISYCARLCFPGYVSQHFLDLLDGYDGVILVAIQDEYDFVENERRALERIKPHVVLTCVPPDQQEHVYPASRFPTTEFIQVLTGYISGPNKLQSRAIPLADRPVHVGYRGRDIGWRYGRLAKMKYEIGEVFQRACLERGVACDIAMDESSRIYGKAWYDWLGRCRCVLGTESGSNVFDFDGSIASEARRGSPSPRILDRVTELDRQFRMGQVSARVFEAASSRTALVLYEGRYSDAIVPFEHYIPVAHDHSNLDQVFRAISDVGSLDSMVDRAHAHLIDSGRFSYRSLADVVREAIERRIGAAPRRGRSQAEPPISVPDRDPFEERPTCEPRPVDSFRLLMMRRSGAQSPPSLGVALRIAAKSVLPPSAHRAAAVFARRLNATLGALRRMVRTPAATLWHFLPLPVRSVLARPVGALRRSSLGGLGR